MSTAGSPDASPYVQTEVLGFVSRVSLRYRKRMLADFLKAFHPGPSDRVLDVGVTCDRRLDSNFFEKLYPYPASITALGMEDGAFLEREFPGVKYVRGNGRELPFEDRSFTFAVSFAVIEHVGSRENQRQFVREICRVADRVCLTTPNRWHPFEFHTLLPFVHWLPPKLFRRVAGVFGKGFLAREENLNLLGGGDLLELVPEGFSARMIRYRLLGFVSNWMLLLERQS